MTDIEVVDFGYKIVLSITAGPTDGICTTTLIALSPYQRQQLIKSLQHPKPYQPKDNNNPSIVI